MSFGGLLKRLGMWLAEHPKQSLRRAYALLPDGAFQLDGMHYTRADVEELLDQGELQILTGVLAGLGDEFEDQYRHWLPAEFWQHLQAAAEKMECTDELKPYMQNGQRVVSLFREGPPLPRKPEDTPE